MKSPMKYIFFAAWLLAVICLTPLIRSMASVNDRESRVAAGREKVGGERVAQRVRDARSFEGERRRASRVGFW